MDGTTNSGEFTSIVLKHMCRDRCCLHIVRKKSSFFIETRKPRREVLVITLFKSKKCIENSIEQMFIKVLHEARFTLYLTMEILFEY